MHTHKQPYSYRFSTTKDRAVETYIKNYQKLFNSLRGGPLVTNQPHLLHQDTPFQKETMMLQKLEKFPFPKIPCKTLSGASGVGKTGPKKRNSAFKGQKVLLGNKLAILVHSLKRFVIEVVCNKQGKE